MPKTSHRQRSAEPWLVLRAESVTSEKVGRPGPGIPGARGKFLFGSLHRAFCTTLECPGCAPLGIPSMLKLPLTEGTSAYYASLEAIRERWQRTTVASKAVTAPKRKRTRKGA
jgi:hypothetical protein